MSLLSSPRRRRRLLWLTPLLGLGAVVAIAIWVLPSNGDSSAVREPIQLNPPPKGPIVPPADPGAERAGRAAAAETRPLANAFVADVIHRRDLDRAHALLAPSLRGKYSLADWQAGRDLPFSADQPQDVVPSTILSFYGPKSVGFVTSFGVDDPWSGEQSTLVAIRFAKSDRWLIDYLRRGHSSRYVSQATYAPHGFLPGTHEETLWTWSVLVLGFAGVVFLVVLADRWLARGPKRQASEAV